MNQTLAEAASASKDCNDIWKALAELDILVSSVADLTNYLALHRDLGLLLSDMCKRVREVFGPGAELCLMMYVDPEIADSYPTLYVRQVTYRSDIIDRIEAVANEFHARLECTSGFFLITTDFRRSRGTHAV